MTEKRRLIAQRMADTIADQRARIAALEAALAPFAGRPDVIKCGALSRGVATEYTEYVERARAVLRGE